MILESSQLAQGPGRALPEKRSVSPNRYSGGQRVLSPRCPGRALPERRSISPDAPPARYSGGQSVPETSVMGEGKSANRADAAAEAVFTVCGFLAVAAAAAIILYMIVSGLPAIRKIGLKEILLGTQWKPTARQPRYGILYVVLTSLGGTFLAVVTGVPAGILAAVYLAEFSGKRRAGLVRGAIELLAGVPSVVYGLLGIYLLTPLVYRLERRVFQGSETHRYTGGACLLSAVLVLAVMMLPTVISVSEASVRAVAPGIREASLALGATKIQTVFLAVLPSARRGLATAAVLGAGRAVGEAMAITLVSGGSVSLPFPFSSVRFLTTAIVSEMGYAQGTHRQMLFAIGVVLLVFVMGINGAVGHILRKGAD